MDAATVRVLAGLLTHPLTLALLVALASALLWRKWPRSGRLVGAAAILIAYLGSISAVGTALVGGLERSYSVPVDSALPAVDYIVVLGSGYTPAPGRSAVGALDADGLARIVEGLRLARLLPSAVLIVSGGNQDPRRAPARGYDRLVRELGGSGRLVRMLDTPRDTAAEATQLAAQVGQSPVLVVTSAYHMRRALRLMRRAGVHAYPAPTGQLADEEGGGLHSWLPSAGGLRKTEVALHEYLGILAIRMGVV